MTTFDEYWEKNKDKYTEIIKQEARKDFQKIEDNQPFVVSVRIDTDDDFYLDCGEDLTTKGTTKKIAVQNMIDLLTNAKLKWVNGNHASSWHYIRDAAIKSLKKGESSFSFGGNQTIETSIIEQKLTIDTVNNTSSKKNKP